ncbi:MerR family transcriptional regulator, partial [Kitasatospora sp. NPDC001574]
MTGTTARALRHYEQAGLLSSGRAPNGYRVYGEGAAVRVRNIRGLLEAGFTLEDVRPFLGCLDRDAFGPPSAGALRIAAGELSSAELAVRDASDTLVRHANAARFEAVRRRSWGTPARPRCARAPPGRPR